MGDRLAIDTIKGYFYQFNLSILLLLKSSNENEEITIEGIEDIDIKNIKGDEDVVQCKYHAKTEYNHSVISKPIRLMLDHYRKVLDGSEKKVSYTYYGHFKKGQNKLTLPLTVEFLKTNLLTFKKDKVEYEHYETLKLSDTELLEFINRLKIDINAQSYEEQLNEIFNLTISEFSGSYDRFEAEHFVYNNALKVIASLAIQADITKRKITKKLFLEAIDKKQILYQKWFLYFKGKKKLLAEIKREYFSSYNISPFERFFLIDTNTKNYSKSELKDLIHLISKKYSDLSKRNPQTFCPYVFIHGISEERLIELKNELRSEKFNFKDGIDFSGASFSVDSMKEKANFQNQIKIKFVNELKYIEELLANISTTKEVYQFYTENQFFSSTLNNIKHIKIQIEEIKDIKSII
ncbi:MAG: hypothetical protein KF704_12355 [Crocinitomicaceae bacterium]|nr:hypothetical protein [Crocinitomicaceae bacterium]